MGVWKSLLERAKEKKDELQRKAVRKAARGAVEAAGKVVDAASKVVEDAVFGEMPESAAKDAEAPPPDPFAKLKKAEAERKAAERAEKSAKGPQRRK